MFYLFKCQLLDSYTKSFKCDACARIAGIWQIQRVLKNPNNSEKSLGSKDAYNTRDLNK